MAKGEQILQEQYGTTKRAVSFYKNQMLHYLNDQMIEFIANQAMVFIATADSNGNCDSSFRAGLVGFVRVIDNKTLIYPEYRGNGVMASLGNIVENPYIGLMFIDFFEHYIGLHINGKASIKDDKQLSSLKIDEKIWDDIREKEQDRAERWVIIEVDEAYIHCSKHIPKLKKLDKTIYWGTDDEKQKSGDFFRAKHSKKD
ncbi:pyridoxamine 5'-phosphate oxidase family protein [Aquibacillus sp. 3ASR75-11]|uniref:Pyridoxamine 5'-phosphate oxidase family protein n=1 Tax=Terrihalobacillus insolitus TaxID=2950438 RepID=A0A9X3WTJ5_9BACI|nr:pyridoxamine 5'-phosphate oxidase family protein [Terrihalobacillus insolitus]MDC3424588.1 pyridoxamine 5'-phosphate oxidase family protein [Terrihalobacillus insolitus]